MLQKYFIEFIINTSFLLLPLLVKISLYGFSIFVDWLNILLLILILIQTYVLVKYHNSKKVYIFLLNISFIFTYFLIRWFIDGFSFLIEDIYIFFIIFVVINAIFRTYLYEKQLLISALYNFLKVGIIPIFYYFILVNENIFHWNIIDFFSKLENRVLAFIFTFFAIFYSILIYIIRKKELEIKKIHQLLKDNIKNIVDGKEFLEVFEKWDFINNKIQFDTKLVYKTIVFIDIRGFTNFSENYSPKETINLLNQFYEIWANILRNYDWKIDKFVWDEIMFIFNDLKKAIYFSQELIKEEIQFLSKYNLEVWIWINSWNIIQWWVWSNKLKEETVIWDVVNIASRLEWWENEIRILKNILPSEFEYKSLGKIKLKWKEKEEEIVSICFLKT